MTPRDAGEPTTVIARWLRPQDYSADTRYRAPARLYGKLSRWIGVPLTSLGLAPRHAVTLEVPGRRTGTPRRNPVLVTALDDVEYLVSLAGESEWVRNVRASGGRAVLHRRGARPVHLLELPPASRAGGLRTHRRPVPGVPGRGQAPGRLMRWMVSSRSTMRWGQHRWSCHEVAVAHAGAMTASTSYMCSTTRKPRAVFVRCIAVLAGAVQVWTSVTSPGRSA